MCNPSSKRGNMRDLTQKALEVSSSEGASLCRYSHNYYHG